MVTDRDKIVAGWYERKTVRPALNVSRVQSCTTELLMIN